MPDYILELKNIGKTFSGVSVLRDINIQFKKGEVHALLGENGAGKSTLIKIMSGYHLPDKGGELYVDGKPVSFKRPKDAMDAHIHTIYQELTLCPDMTVAENIVIDKQNWYPGVMQNQKKYYELAKQAMQRLGQDIDPNAMVRSLSIAQQQVVEIAKAITADAKVILMDEPTSSISQKDSECLLDIVRNLRDSGVTIIYISHRLHEISEIADRITVLRDGNYVGTVEQKDITSQQLINMMVGREMNSIYPKKNVQFGEVVLKVEKLTTDVFKDVSFEVRKGEIFGIGGLVGAKRTEILETLFGLRPVVSGKISLYGEEYIPRTPKQAIEKGMAFITEDRKKSGLVLCLSVNENINMVNAGRLSRYGVLNGRRFQEISEKYKGAFNIRLATLKQAAQTLSGGNQQKVVLAKWMEMKPQIVLFDEPTRGIDIGAKTEIYNIMSELAEQGVAIVMVSSELPELISVTDQILVMCEGKMACVIDRELATQEHIMAYAAAQL